MLSGVGMTDIAVGTALWSGLVCQIAVRMRDRDGDPRHAKTFKSAAITQRHEISARLQDEVSGRRTKQ